jgi:putative oxidoreductase
MPTNIDCRNRVHQRVAGATPDEILAAIRADCCQPPSEPVTSARTISTAPAIIRTEPDPALPDHDNKAATGDAMTSLVHHARRFRDLASMIPHSMIALLARASIATIFWRAASTKLANFDLTIALFQDEYLKNLPFLPAAPMAYLATAVELSMPALILAGLLTRLATLPLIGMALFIQTFVYPMSWPDHLVWITLLGFLLARGPGAISLDVLLARQFDRNGAAMRAGV